MTEDKKISPPQKKRTIYITIILIFVILLYLLYIFLFSKKEEYTDNAYVNGHIVSIFSQVNGIVSLVTVDNTDTVQEGELLAKVDSNDITNTFNIEASQLDLAIRNLLNISIQKQILEKNIQNRNIELERATLDSKNRSLAYKGQAVTQEEYKHAQDNVNLSKNNKEIAQLSYKQTAIQLGNNDIINHPSIQIEINRLKQLSLNIERHSIQSPTEGMVARKNINIGSEISIGTRLMDIIPLNQLWVDANFKESQIKNMCPGQPVKITTDMYGTKIIYHGIVENIGAGSGASLALLPAQNATGNWIKVTQRIPVKIKLNSNEIKEHPLRIGLSTMTTVDTSQCNKNYHNTKNTKNTNIYLKQEHEANNRVNKIVDKYLKDNNIAN